MSPGQRNAPAWCHWWPCRSWLLVVALLVVMLVVTQVVPLVVMLVVMRDAGATCVVT